MGSGQQIIVGVLLLVCAFVFGRYVHNKPPERGSDKAQTADLLAEDSALPQQSVFAKKGQLVQGEMASNKSNSTGPPEASLQQTLRDRILGNRARNSNQSDGNRSDLVASQQTPLNKLIDRSITSSKTPQKNRNTDTIVEPDFSALELTGLDSKSRDGNATDRSAPIESQTREPVLVGPIPNSRKRLSPEFPQYHSDKIAADQQGKSLTPNIIGPKSPPRDEFTQETQIARQPEKRVASRSRLTKVRNRGQHLSIIANDYLTHKSIDGDTLHSISNKYYGKPDFYLDIYVSNRDKLASPSSIPVGTKLKIPVYNN